MDKKVVLTGGGTAGHVTPNLAIIPKLKEKGYEVEYIGTKEGMENAIVSEAGVPFHAVSAGKLRRYLSMKNLTDPFRMLKGISQSKKILKSINPCAVFSKGGFVGVPVVLAARRLKIPVVLHESDYTPGLANRICIPRAQKICVSFKSTLKHIPEGKGVYTGLPIRSELLEGDRERGLKLCGFKGERPVLLIMGGSTGARALNELVDAAMPGILAKFDVIHIRGNENLLSGLVPPGYRQFGFAGRELADIYAASDIAVSRAGATAVFELLALKLPALLIPLPKSASRGDQIQNARYFERNGFSHSADQEKLCPDALLGEINRLYRDREKLRAAMERDAAADAAANVVKVIEDACARA